MTVEATHPRSATLVESRFATFAIMWALANLIHLINQSAARLDDPTEWINLLAAVAVLRRPSSVLRVALLAGAQLLMVAWAMPFAPDHAMLAAAVDALVLLAAARATRTRMSADGPAASFFAAFAGPARVVLLIAYTTAAVAKYNHTFLDPATSCAVTMAEAVTFDLVAYGPAMAPVAVAVAVGVESLIPVLLVVPWTRSVGARVGIVFHFLVSLSPTMQVGDFTTLLWPLFMLFLTEAEQDAMAQRMRDMLDRSDIVQRLRAIGWWPVGVSLVAAAGVVGWIPGVSDLAVRIGLGLAVFVYGTAVVVSALRTPWDRTRTRLVGGWPGIGAVIVVIAFVIWCLNPYLGFRTTGSFTMFSNLRTEGPGTNHLFMPSLHLVPHQNDLVELVRSDNADVQSLAARHHAVPFMEVQRLAADGVALTGRRDGELLTVPSPDGAVGPPNPLLAKVWSFRTIPVDGPPGCAN